MIVSSLYNLFKSQKVSCMSTTNTPFTWQSEVRGYEIDLQGIVNNAVYLQYLDHARILYLMSKGVDWELCHKQGYNLVLHHVDLKFKHSLRQHDRFYVTTDVERQGRLKIVFHQSIIKEDNTVIADAKSTCVWVSTVTGKPTAPENLIHPLLSA